MVAFNYSYNPLTYQAAQKQASGQIDPLYNRALQNVNAQKYQSDVQAGQVARARGLGHSGLAADQLNKIAIAAQGQIGDLGAQRATQLAQMSNDLMQQDKQFNLQNRSQAFNEWSNQRNFDYQKAQDALAEQWKQKEWNDMSPAEKAQMALQYSYSKKSKSGGGGGKRKTTSPSSNPLNSNTVPSKPTSNSAIDYYYNNPTIQAVENAKQNSDLVSKYFSSPTPPAQSPYLSAWAKMKMFGM